MLDIMPISLTFPRISSAQPSVTKPAAKYVKTVMPDWIRHPLPLWIPAPALALIQGSPE
ncbi:hypothetical protein ARNL5_02130 [Anaerolineae bacterium]|nr:hypothetical protein ARNL5_02130 [Anaerolineae bacterium]